MLAGHLGGKDAYTFVGEGGGICLAGAAVFKRDVIAREVLDVLLDFEIGARILVSGGSHFVGCNTLLLYYFIIYFLNISFMFTRFSSFMFYYIMLLAYAIASVCASISFTAAC